MTYIHNPVILANISGTFMDLPYTCLGFLVWARGRTYVMITYVSKENDLGPDDKVWVSVPKCPGKWLYFINQ